MTLGALLRCSAQLRDVLSRMQQTLKDERLCWSDLLLAKLFVADMGHYAAVNVARSQIRCKP